MAAAGKPVTNGSLLARGLEPIASQPSVLVESADNVR
ncbi:MAG: hypothetical protein ACI8V4_001691, partial [Ilumatobacter sp.]